MTTSGGVRFRLYHNRFTLLEGTASDSGAGRSRTVHARFHLSKFIESCVVVCFLLLCFLSDTA